MVKLLSFNQHLTYYLTSFASLRVEFGLPTGRLLTIVDRTTMVWSGVIALTSGIKFFLNDSLSNHHGAGQPVAHPEGHSLLLDLLLLNYLPGMNDFGRLYYGLEVVLILISLLWRIHVNFYLPHQRAIHRPRKQTDGKKNLVHFYIFGPSTSSSSSSSSSETNGRSEEKNNNDDGGERLSTRVHHHHNLVANDINHPTEKTAGRVINSSASFAHSGILNLRQHSLSFLDGSHQLARKSPLSYVYKSPFLIDNANDNNNEIVTSIAQDELVNPIRVVDFLAYPKPRVRWSFLLRRMLAFAVVVTVFSVPLNWLMIKGFNSIMSNFTRTDTNFYLILACYGCLEQIYICSQGAIFYLFSNGFVTLFHADLVFTSRIIIRDLKKLKLEYLKLSEEDYSPSVNVQSFKIIISNANSSSSTSGKNLVKDSIAPNSLINNLGVASTPVENIRYQQLRLWAYFDYIKQLDDFVSRFNVVSIILFSLGLQVGPSFLKIEDSALQTATLAIMVMNMISFSYTYIVSWNIEKHSNRMHNVLLFIAARDPNFVTKHIWQKMLVAFYGYDCMRTFTLFNSYPLNLHSYIKTAVGFATMSLLLNRLMHTNGWDTIFSHHKTQTKVY